MLIIDSILLAIAAFTYSEVLTQPEMILSRPAYYLEEYWPEWLAKPLMLCCKCVAGQWALWLYLFYFTHTIRIYNWQFVFGSYDFVLHVWFVLQCIFNIAIIRAAYYKIVGVQNVRNVIPLRKAPTPPELKID